MGRARALDEEAAINEYKVIHKEEQVNEKKMHTHRAQ